MTGYDTQASGSGGDLAATWQGLAQVPQLMNEVRAGVLTLKSLISVPQAAVATGSPAASSAIVALGANLAVFLFQTVEAIDQDIRAMQQVQRNYQGTEHGVTAEMLAGQRVVEQQTPALSPALAPTTGGSTGDRWAAR